MQQGGRRKHRTAGPKAVTIPMSTRAVSAVVALCAVVAASSVPAAPAVAIEAKLSETLVSAGKLEVGKSAVNNAPRTIEAKEDGGEKMHELRGSPPEFSSARRFSPIDSLLDLFDLGYAARSSGIDSGDASYVNGKLQGRRRRADDAWGDGGSWGTRRDDDLPPVDADDDMDQRGDPNGGGAGGGGGYGGYGSSGGSSYGSSGGSSYGNSGGSSYGGSSSSYGDYGSSTESSNNGGYGSSSGSTSSSYGGYGSSSSTSSSYGGYGSSSYGSYGSNSYGSSSYKSPGSRGEGPLGGLMKVQIPLIAVLLLFPCILFAGMAYTAHTFERSPESTYANFCRLTLHTMRCAYRLAYNLYHCRLGEIPGVVCALEDEDEYGRDYTDEELDTMKLRPGIGKALDVEHRKALKRTKETELKGGGKKGGEGNTGGACKKVGVGKKKKGPAAGKKKGSYSKVPSNEFV